MNIIKMTETEEKNILESVKKFPLSMKSAAKESGLSYSKFRRRAKKLGVFSPNQGQKGTFGKSGVHIKDILEGKTPHYKSGHVKKRLIRDGIIENKCNKCGIEKEYNGKDIVLELDHINGINSDHRIENLRILCPNCHSQTPTFRSKNND